MKTGIVRERNQMKTKPEPATAYVIIDQVTNPAGEAMSEPYSRNIVVLKNVTDEAHAYDVMEGWLKTETFKGFEIYSVTFWLHDVLKDYAADRAFEIDAEAKDTTLSTRF